MNSRFKFRAWNKTDKRMERDVQLCEGRYECDACFGYVLGEEDRIVMQWTGFKDSKGQDIYEGDIMSFIEVDENSCLGAEEKITGTVKWIDDLAEFRLEETTGRRRELRFVVDLPTVYDDEVNGNVYENPELLSQLT